MYTYISHIDYLNHFIPNADPMIHDVVMFRDKTSKTLFQ